MPACRGRSDGNQRGVFSPPICPFKEVQRVEAVMGAHSFVRCHADADPRQRLESAGWLESAGRTKRCAPTLCYAGEGKSRDPRDPRNRADITFGPGTGVL